MAELTFDEWSARLREVFDRAAKGECFALVESGRVVARLVPEPRWPDLVRKAVAQGRLKAPALEGPLVDADEPAPAALQGRAVESFLERRTS